MDPCSEAVAQSKHVSWPILFLNTSDTLAILLLVILSFDEMFREETPVVQ